MLSVTTAFLEEEREGRKEKGGREEKRMGNRKKGNEEIKGKVGMIINGWKKEKRSRLDPTTTASSGRIGTLSAGVRSEKESEEGIP